LEEKINKAENINDLLLSIDEELIALKEYTEYKNLLDNLKNKIEEITKRALDPQKKELDELKRQIKLNPNNPEELKKAAKLGRKKAYQEIDELVSKLSHSSNPLIRWLANKVKKS